MLLWAIRRMQRPESLLNFTYRHNTSSLPVRVQSSKNRDMAIRWKQNWKPCFYLLLHFFSFCGPHQYFVNIKEMPLTILVWHLQKSEFLSVLNTHSSQHKFDITQNIHWLRDIKTETTEKSCYLDTLNTRNDTVLVTRVTSE